MLKDILIIFTDCGRSTWAMTGTFHTEGFPQSYYDYQHCYLTLNTVAGSEINIIVENMDVEFHENCVWDMFKVSNLNINIFIIIDFLLGYLLIDK